MYFCPGITQTVNPICMKFSRTTDEICLKAQGCHAVSTLASYSVTMSLQVEWVLEVIRFGLSLPLQEHEALRDCVRVCCAWLAPLLPPAPPAMPPPPSLPPPVAAAPRVYARKILRHLQNLFVPRPNESKC